jgi:hypothetical protein
MSLSVRSAVTEQAADADAIVDEAMAAGLDGSDPLTVHVKMLRAELLGVKADLERELEKVVLDCTVCGKRVHFVGASASAPGAGRMRNRRRTRRRRSRRSGGSAAGNRAGSRSSAGAVLVGMLRETGRARSSAGRVRTPRPNGVVPPAEGKEPRS